MLYTMKKYNNMIKYGKYFLVCAISTMLAYACTDRFENADLKQVSDGDLEIDAVKGGMLLPGMMNNIVSTSAGDYQRDNNHNGDAFSGYLSSPTPFQGNIQNRTYAMSDAWNSPVWTVPSEGVLNQWVQMSKGEYDVKYPDLYAIGLICKVFVGHRLVDIFGPIPYTEYGSASEVSFDSEEVAYNAFFDDLAWSIDALMAVEDENPNADQFRFARFDKSLFRGDYAKWIKMANTLRLRLAIRVSYVNPEKAKSEAEAAVDNPYGVLEVGDGSFAIIPPTTHPLEQMSNAWSDVRMGATIVTYLEGLNDPRLEVYALPATDQAVAGQYIGIRNGIDIAIKETYVNFSAPNFEQTTPVKIMDGAESYFLRAEGALNGWAMGGTAQQLYEDGVRASFQLNGVSGADEYLSNATAVPTDYTDPKNSNNDGGILTTTTIKWEEGASAEEKIERILTQKWIAMYPEGREAWAEIRRTGYPKVYPNVVNYSGGLIPEGEFIRRLTYPTSITNASKAAVDEAVSQYLGGNDSPYTLLWWDVE